MKRNNPLNIRFTNENDWLGQLGNDNGFVNFASPYYGMRAAIRLVCKYIINGYCTVEEIIYRWAPPSENSTESYICFVLDGMRSQGLSIERDESLFIIFTRFRSRVQLSVLLQAMNMFENGIENCQLTYDDWFKMMDKPKIINMLAELELEVFSKSNSSYDSKCDI